MFLFFLTRPGFRCFQSWPSSESRILRFEYPLQALSFSRALSISCRGGRRPRTESSALKEIAIFRALHLRTQWGGIGRPWVPEENNLFWIRRFYVSPQLLRTFLFAGKGFASDSCIPPADFETIPLDGILFDFGVDSVGYLLPHLISSEEVIFRGKLESSKPFRIRISLTQDRR